MFQIEATVCTREHSKEKRRGKKGFTAVDRAVNSRRCTDNKLGCYSDCSGDDTDYLGQPSLTCGSNPSHYPPPLVRNRSVAVRNDP